MDFFYADCMDGYLNMPGEPVWEYRSSGASCEQKSWEEIKKRKYCVLFVTSLEDSEGIEQYLSSKKIVRKNCLVIEANKYFHNWLRENRIELDIEHKLVSALKNINEKAETLEAHFAKAVQVSEAIKTVFSNKEYREKLISVFSYHTFVFPFYIVNPSYEIPTWKEELENSSCWQHNSWRNMMTTAQMQQRDVLEKYSLYQYLTDVGRKAIFDYEEDAKKKESNIVSSWKLEDSLVRNRGTYEITKGNTCYKLLLNSIRLAIYNTRIALLIIETQNCYYPAIRDIKQINEYGRRIFEPYMTENGEICNLCADKQEICIPGMKKEKKESKQNNAQLQNVEARFKNDKVVFEQNGKEIRSVPVKGISDFIKNILEFGLKNIQFIYEQSEETKKKYQIEIKPAIDDRMFVSCLVLNGNLISKVQKKTSDGYAYLEDLDISSELYALLCIDSESASCQSETMRRDLLEEFVDPRWIDWGTIHAVTHHSLVCLTSETAPESAVISPFLNIYTKMANLVLAQRASLLRFEEELRKLSQGFEEGNAVKTRTKIVKQLILFQEQYAAFQAQILIDELTVQEQGIELYELLQKELQIEKNEEKIAAKINVLCEIADTRQGQEFNIFAFWFALASITISGVGIANEIGNLLNPEEGKKIIDAGIDIVLVTLTIFFIAWPLLVKYVKRLVLFIEKKSRKFASFKRGIKRFFERR